MKTEAAAQVYYNGAGLTVPYKVAYPGLDSQPHLVDDMRTFKHAETLDEADVDEAMDEIARSIRLIHYGGSTFEIATANDGVESDEVMLHISTYSSAISTNHGNGYEFAAQAVRYPQFRHLYVSSSGMGSSSRMLRKDEKFSGRTGRFTEEKDGATYPLKSLQNLHNALQANGLNVTRLMGTDSAGGHYARALSVAMEKGQLSHAFFSETSGFVDLSSVGLAAGMLIKENIFNSKNNRSVSPDPEQMTKEKVERFTEAFEKHADLPNRKEVTDAKVSTKDNLMAMRTSLNALKHGPTKDANPLAEDTNALLDRHPHAKLTYGVAEHDPLYKGPENASGAAQRFLGALSVQRAPVRVALIPGMTHAYNTFFPSLYHAIKREALDLG
jgi:hypothetical protein